MAERARLTLSQLEDMLLDMQEKLRKALEEIESVKREGIATRTIAEGIKNRRRGPVRFG